MERVQVSVIMGIYNCEQFLPQAIHSILEQTYTNWELIMCDDGSQDQSYQIACAFAEQYPTKIQVIRNQENRGLAYSLNHCLQYAQGNYIARMDADDYAYPSRFAKQLAFLEQNPSYDLVGSAVDLSDGNEVVGYRFYGAEPGKQSVLLGVPFVHPTIIMKKSVYQALGGYSVVAATRRCEDLDLWCRFYHQGYKGYNLAEPLVQYHESVADYQKRNLKTALQIIKVRQKGYRLLKFPWFYYPLLVKPIISALIPNKIMYWYHKR